MKVVDAAAHYDFTNLAVAGAEFLNNSAGTVVNMKGLSEFCGRVRKAIRMTDAVKFEFEVVTSNHSYKFRGSDKTNAFQWVNGLQQLHNRVLHAK